LGRGTEMGGQGSRKTEKRFVVSAAQNPFWSHGLEIFHRKRNYNNMVTPESFSTRLIDHNTFSSKNNNNNNNENIKCTRIVIYLYARLDLGKPKVLVEHRQIIK